MIDAGASALMLTILVVAGWTDIRSRRIPNILSIALVDIFILRGLALMLVSDVSLAVLWVWPLVTAGGIFLVGLLMFARGIIGGGDVKLLAALALFAGPAFILPTLFVMSVAGGLIALAMLIRLRLIPSKDSTTPNHEASAHALKVPYGLAIMTSGFWLTWTLHGAVLGASVAH